MQRIKLGIFSLSVRRRRRLLRVVTEHLCSTLRVFVHFSGCNRLCGGVVGGRRWISQSV